MGRNLFVFIFLSGFQIVIDQIIYMACYCVSCCNIYVTEKCFQQTLVNGESKLMPASVTVALDWIGRGARVVCEWAISCRLW